MYCIQLMYIYTCTCIHCIELFHTECILHVHEHTCIHCIGLIHTECILHVLYTALLTSCQLSHVGCAQILLQDSEANLGAVNNRYYMILLCACTRNYSTNKVRDYYVCSACVHVCNYYTNEVAVVAVWAYSCSSGACYCISKQ